MHQIMAITHLPQIAAMGDLHLAVVKRIEADRTLTGVTPLSENDRTREVARLFSGADITETSLQLAKELIETGRSA
jgi:DNA repair protein RecN (Recombination protein N)